MFVKPRTCVPMPHPAADICSKLHVMVSFSSHPGTAPDLPNSLGSVSSLRHHAALPLQEHCLMGIKGTVRRTTDGHLIHANIDTDIIISEETPTGSTKKPEELYRVIERFAQGDAHSSAGSAQELSSLHVCHSFLVLVFKNQLAKELTAKQCYHQCSSSCAMMPNYHQDHIMQILAGNSLSAMKLVMWQSTVQ